MATVVTNRPGRFRLYCKPALHYFSKSRQSELEARLHRNDRVTSIQSLMTPQELQLDKYGKTLQGGYEYTSASFQQLCRILSAGASAFLRDIAGENPHRDDRERLSNGQFARRLFNEVVELRFPLLTAYRVIRDEESKLIDGVIGSKHFTLENSALYEQVQAAVAATAKPVVFYSGVLSGRKMLLWYRSRRPFLIQQVGGSDVWKFYSGYFFCNGEARGTSARGTMALFCKRGVCLGPYQKYGGRVPHIGRDFNRRLDKLFGKIFSKEVPIDQFRDGLASMLAEPLGCSGLEKKELVARIRTLARAMTALNIPQRIAEQIVEDALYVGHESTRPEAGMPLAYRRDRLFASRTTFDLFVCLIRSAGRMNLSRREVLEQAAWQMLAGDFHL